MEFDNNRSDTDNTTRKPRSVFPVLIVLAIIVGVGWWYFDSKQESDEPIVTKMEEAPMIETKEPVVVEPEVTEPEPAEPPLVLPSLNQSDDFVRQQVDTHEHTEMVDQWLESDNLVRRATALVDGMSRGQILTKVSPLGSAPGKFQATKQQGQYYLAPENYNRYDNIANALTGIEPSKMAGMIKTIKPLLEKAFNEQGYPNRSFDDALKEALDEVISTPVIEQPIALELESVYFQFKDPAIESLSPVQKQLIRSGPENTRKIQEYAKQLKMELGY